MKLIKIVSTVAVLALISAAQAKATPGFTLINSGFELPDLGSGSSAYGYGPDYGGQTVGTPTSYTLPGLPSTPPGWTFIGTSGIAANGSAFGVTGATNGNSDGTTSTSGQAGFIQSAIGLNNGAIEQTITLSAGSYTLSFAEEGRSAQGGANEIQVSLGGSVIYTGLPTSTGSFNTITRSVSVSSSGPQLLSFAGLSPNSGDYTTFVDHVSVSRSAVPEPSDWAWLPVLGTISFIAWRRLSRQAVA